MAEDGAAGGGRGGGVTSFCISFPQLLKLIKEERDMRR